MWLGLLTIMLGFFYGYRALLRAGLPLRQQQGLMVLVLLLAILLVLRGHLYAGPPQGKGWLAMLIDHLSDLSILLSGEMVAAGLMIYLWGRAMHLAGRSLSTVSVGLTFRAGIVILVWFGLAVGLLLRRDVTAFVLPYFFFSLVAVALARIEEVSQLPGGSQAQFSGYWVGSSVAAVAVLVLAGAALAALFAGGGLQPVLRLLTPIFYVVVGLLVGVALLMFALLQAITAGLHLNWGAVGQLLQDLLVRLQKIAAGLEQPSTQPADPGLLRAIHLSGNLLLIGGLVVLILALTWLRLRRGREEPGNETRESVLSLGSIADGLAALLRGGRRRLAGLAGRVGLNQFLAAISIRHIYANLVRLASEAGYPRAAAQTPYEYLDVLRRAFPEGQVETALITNAYVRAHYGELPDTPAELQRIRDAWQRVREQQSTTRDRR
jgi:hypothetical protein